MAAFSLMRNNSWCPPCTGVADQAAAVRLLHMLAAQHRVAAVAVTAAHDVLILRNRGRSPIVRRSPHHVLHMHHEHQQVRCETGPAGAMPLPIQRDAQP